MMIFEGWSLIVGFTTLTGIPGLVNIQTAIEHGPVEIVDLPSYKMVIFHSSVSLAEGIWMNNYWNLLLFFQDSNRF
jgi:hypothetical protein